MDVKSSPFRYVGSCLALLMITAIGCGKAEEPGSKKSESDDQTASLNPEDLLVGTWYGKAKLNQDLLKQKLASIPDSGERAQLQQIALNFQTTEIGANFSDSGEMLLDIQVTANGQLLRDSTQGTWRALNVEKNAVFVETEEQLPQGGTEKNRVRYQFENDGNVAVMVAPTSELLAGCNPVFVFERILPESVADGANNGTLK